MDITKFWRLIQTLFSNTHLDTPKLNTQIQNNLSIFDPTTSKLFFIHIGKTGGTSLQLTLKKHFKHKHNENEQKFEGCHCDISYAKALQHEDLKRPLKLITLLRHPVDRMISHFYYRKTLETFNFKDGDTRIEPNQKFLNMDLRTFLNDWEILEKYKTL